MNIDFYPDKAQYITGEPVKLIIEAFLTGAPDTEAAVIITRLERTIGTIVVVLKEGVNEIELSPFCDSFAGFGAILKLTGEESRRKTVGLNKERKEEDAPDEEPSLEYHTAFDVVSVCKKAIRYGFLSDFRTSDGEDHTDISLMRKLHINMVQYYDWAYRHDDLVAKASTYHDLMGKEMNLDTIKKKITLCHAYGMKAIGYGAVYAASREFYKTHPEWGLYTSAGEPLVFIDTFYLMNVEETSPWRDHMIQEYAKAIEEVDFDGMHMDTYGFPKTAYSYQKKRLIRMEEEYPSLIEDTKKRLEGIKKDTYLIFNNVGNWPVKTVAATAQAAVYIEVWKPYVSYEHIRQIIWNAQRECQHTKPVILAAYLEPFRTDTMERAANAAYLLTAVITANGAYHLLLGEDRGVLTQGYYVDYSIITTEVSEKLRAYYDHIVQYTELFFDAELIDVSMTHIGWDNTEYRCLHTNWSVTGEADKIWLIIREKEYRKLISLINLCGNDENGWNASKKQPKLQQQITLQIQIDHSIAGVYFCSPDYDYGKSLSLPYELIKTDRGWVMEFIVPYLSIWSNVWIDFKEEQIIGS